MAYENSKNSWKNYSTSAVTPTEIRSHSAVLFNERINALFAMYDMEAMDMEIRPSIKECIKVNAMLKSLWRNVRPIVMSNTVCRIKLGLNTIHPGLYTIDVGFAHIQECIDYMISVGKYPYSKLRYVIDNIHLTENILREILQFFSYFVRTDSLQKPDISMASEKYKAMADTRTVEEFNEILGKGKRGLMQNQQLEIPVGDEFFDDFSDEMEKPD